jgi:hypothetical protein
MKDCFSEPRNPDFIKRERTILLFEVTFFFITMLLFSCADKPKEQKKNISSSVKGKKVWTDKDESALKELLKKFNSTKDAANNIVWYSHKSIPAMETNIHAEVNGTDNYCYLISMYYGKSQLSHDSVQIMLDANVFSTNKISAPDRRNRRSKYKGSFLETIHFTEGNDKDIPKLIALNYQKNIIVKLIGQKQNFEYALSNKFKKSIKDAYELTETLKRKSSAF